MAQQNKTEKPTPWRLQQARDKGDVPRSRELIVAVSLLAAVLYLAMTVPFMGRTLLGAMRGYFGRAGETAVTVASLGTITRDFSLLCLKLLGPLFTILIAVAFLTTANQGGFKFLLEKIHFKTDFFKPLAGLKRMMFSFDSMLELAKSILKVLFIGWIAYSSVKNEFEGLFLLPDTSLENIMMVTGRLFFKVAFNIVIFMLILSIFDYLIVRFRYTRKLKMSKEEVKDEYKQKEGDPKIKSKQKQIQYNKAIQRMMAQVPKADVVITNPTHFAVALRYEFKEMQSPQVVAKGQDLVALRIRDKAREHHVPVVENPPLARGLYAAAEVGEFIPAEYFQPVAEVLAYIYKIKGKKVS